MLLSPDHMHTPTKAQTWGSYLLLLLLTHHHLESFICYSSLQCHKSTLGAKLDGRTNSTRVFLNAWAAACAFTTVIFVPKSRKLFASPCSVFMLVKKRLPIPQFPLMEPWSGSICNHILLKI